MQEYIREDVVDVITYMARRYDNSFSDSKSGAAQAVEGSTPLPSADKALRDNELRKAFVFAYDPPVSSCFLRATPVLRSERIP
jgi:hypothetical protein